MFANPLDDALVDYAMTLLGAVIGVTLWPAPRWRILTLPVLAIPVALGCFLACRLIMAVLPALSGAAGPIGNRLAIATVYGLLGLLAGMREWRSGDRVTLLRGARVVGTSNRLAVLRLSSPVELRLAGQLVPRIDEPKHFKIVGTTGTGKTTAIAQLIDGALARGDRAIIADPDEFFLERFFDDRRGDLILGPLHPRACRWDLFAEVRTIQDADGIARALVPDLGGDDRAWRAYVRVLLASTIRQLLAASCRDPLELHRLITVAAVDELRELLNGTPAAAYLTPDNGRFFASVRAIASSELAPLELVANHRGTGQLSVRDWIDEGSRDSRPGVLFLPYRASHLATLRGLLACWLRIALFEKMEQREKSLPLWFVADELDSLGNIDGLKDALTRVRKYGGRCVLGMQSIAQLTGNYGASAAQTIIENCGNTLLLRCSAAENGGTARFASTLIGDREVLRTHVSRTRTGFFGKPDPSRSYTTQRHTERAVLPAQIEQLPDLEGYLKFASTAEWRRVTIAAQGRCQPPPSALFRAT